jgi:hypothetical protein
MAVFLVMMLRAVVELLRVAYEEYSEKQSKESLLPISFISNVKCATYFVSKR